MEIVQTGRRVGPGGVESAGSEVLWELACCCYFWRYLLAYCYRPPEREQMRNHPGMSGMKNRLFARLQGLWRVPAREKRLE